MSTSATPIPDLSTYLRAFGTELGDKVIESFPPLHATSDEPSPALAKLKRKPFAAQSLAIMGVVRRLETARAAAVVAECGTGKSLISLGSVFAHADGRPFTALVMAPPQLLDKWIRECFSTIPNVRVFVIDGVRNGVGSNGYTGVNEVRLRHGRIVREGIETTLSDMRLAKGYRSAHSRWLSEVRSPSIFVLSRERAKLSCFWRHAYTIPKSGPYRGNAVNPDTGRPVVTDDDQVRLADFRKTRIAETVAPESPHDRKSFYSPLWQADRSKVQRFAPAEFIGRFMKNFFDYFIADEVHELKSGETAQGNALGTLAAACKRTVVLTGTLLGGYADELFFLLQRINGNRLREDGYVYGESGVRQFAETYGVLEKITTVEAAENAASKGKTSVVVKRRPGASPLLFGKYLMDLAAFVSLEDISGALPPYDEEVISVEMDPALEAAYRKLEGDISAALKEHRGNTSVISTGMHALLQYPDRPYDLGTLYGFMTNQDGYRERFAIAEPPDLDPNFVYAKERRLIEECGTELENGRRVMVFATYTNKRDVTRRLQRLLVDAGVRCEVLTADVAPERREAWFDRKLAEGMQVAIANPVLVQTGLDLYWAKTVCWVQTGFSTYTLRQASRRSWRIGQKDPIRVLFFPYRNSAQESCLRLIGKKLLVSLAMEGKLEGGGLQSLEGDDDVLTAMARELVSKGVGESAAAVWRAVLQQTLESRPAATPLSTALIHEPPQLVVPPAPELWTPRSKIAEQLSLF